MRWIYLSPHLDDAVLSAGGLIYDQTRSGIPVEIWTFMCGYPPEGGLSPFAQKLHEMWGTTGADETIRIRRAEDVNAAGILGATTQHFDFLDCIYRRGRDGEWLYTDVFVPPDPRESDLPQQIADAISARLKPDDVLVCQLSIGPHIDHVTVRLASELLGRPLLYDADVPYWFTYWAQLAAKSARMKAEARSVTKAGLRAWQEAIAAYASQLSMLFESPEKMRRDIAGYCADHGGIRLWKPVD